jgi:hypothetical protein
MLSMGLVRRVEGDIRAIEVGVPEAAPMGTEHGAGHRDPGKGRLYGLSLIGAPGTRTFRTMGRGEPHCDRSMAVGLGEGEAFLWGQALSLVQRKPACGITEKRGAAMMGPAAT